MVSSNWLNQPLARWGAGGLPIAIIIVTTMCWHKHITRGYFSKSDEGVTVYRWTLMIPTVKMSCADLDCFHHGYVCIHRWYVKAHDFFFISQFHCLYCVTDTLGGWVDFTLRHYWQPFCNLWISGLNMKTFSWSLNRGVSRHNISDPCGWDQMVVSPLMRWSLLCLLLLSLGLWGGRQEFSRWSGRVSPRIMGVLLWSWSACGVMGSRMRIKNVIIIATQ